MAEVKRQIKEKELLDEDMVEDMSISDDSDDVDAVKHVKDNKDDKVFGKNKKV